MQAEIFESENGKDSYSVIPPNQNNVFVVNNYRSKKIDETRAYPVIIDDISYGVSRAFPATWDDNKNEYILLKGWFMYGGRLVHASNSAGYTFKQPAKLMDRLEP
jgi:hypothetical protein